MLKKLKKYRFLFEELVKRDFTKKYKRTVLGVFWSALAPLASLGVMALVFTHFFGRNINHFIIYLFCGNIVMSYFKESTNTGMQSLYANSSIFSKVNVPKYLFLLSSNVSVLFSFGINICLLMLFCIIDGVPITWKFIFLIYPICCLVIFNLGVGLILSAFYMKFRDMKYLYNIFTQLLTYLSGIFYSIDSFPSDIQRLFYLNPIYVYVRYFRIIILEREIPQLIIHFLALFYAALVLIIGAVIYKKNNYKFLYYV